MTRSNRSAQAASVSERERLATPADVAAYLQTSVDGLSQLRYRRQGPPFVKVGQRVLYRWSDVHSWVADRVRAN
ncbi:helix-turn-helix transcriptional regulator [Mycolicibacterium lacusdiani]|uniref:helix-turn-helix transcriptional regulator n=1 Tax=Mycolicibacterium lacusdiani TaxID=2895283 RepID=UPI001F4380C6